MRGPVVEGSVIAMKNAGSLLEPICKLYDDLDIDGNKKQQVMRTSYGDALFSASRKHWISYRII
jgi:hypothetical protein